MKIQDKNEKTRFEMDDEVVLIIAMMLFGLSVLAILFTSFI